jgi:hypothetical protein
LHSSLEGMTTEELGFIYDTHMQSNLTLQIKLNLSSTALVLFLSHIRRDEVCNLFVEIFCNLPTDDCISGTLWGSVFFYPVLFSNTIIHVTEPVNHEVCKYLSV